MEISRRRLLGWMAGGGAAVAGVILGEGLTPGVAEAIVTRLTLEVAPDLSTFQTVDGTLPGPFYIQGPIFPEGTLNPDGTIPPGATPIGTFRCWGWIFDATTLQGVVSQAYELDDQGKIQVQGLEDDTRAVTGGTGDFRMARGQGSFEVINPANLSFRVTFHLLGVRR